MTDPVPATTVAPLRTVIRTEVRHGVPYEHLECGHVVMSKLDIIGFTNARRRRCNRCRCARSTQIATTEHTP